MLGVFGGSGTFADQAAVELARRHPEVAGGKKYYVGALDALDALRSGDDLEAAIAGADMERYGHSPETVTRLVSGHPALYVVDEAIVPYGCCLLAKPGTVLDAIKTVFGHHSLTLAAEQLAVRLPQAELVMHPQSTASAAIEVVEGDGTNAVVGTRSAAELHGLNVVAEDIDGHARAAWWLIKRELQPSDKATHVIVGLRHDGAPPLGHLVERLVQMGWVLRSVYTSAGELGLFERYVLLVLVSRAPLSIGETERIVREVDARIVGHFS